MDPEWLSADEANAGTMHRVGAFAMTDQSGRTITESALDGRVTLVQFFFTACGDICPTTTTNLADALREIGDDPRVQLLSISIAGERDSVGVLAEFAKARGITDARWRLLSAPRSEVERVARESYFLRLGDGKNYGVSSVEHTETVFLVDGERRIRGIYAGTLRLEVARMVEDLGEVVGATSVFPSTTTKAIALPFASLICRSVSDSALFVINT
jgi:protein SCO1/2